MLALSLSLSFLTFSWSHTHSPLLLVLFVFPSCSLAFSPLMAKSSQQAMFSLLLSLPGCLWLYSPSHLKKKKKRTFTFAQPYPGAAMSSLHQLHLTCGSLTPHGATGTYGCGIPQLSQVIMQTEARLKPASGVHVSSTPVAHVLRHPQSRGSPSRTWTVTLQ